MRSASLIASAAVIVISNALALTHAARNRTGAPDAEITLTQRELRYFNDSVADDDSGVALNLQWTDLDTSALPTGVERIASLLDRQKLRSLGFACSVDPASPDAERYYQRQEARQVFVALEYNGAAWRAWAQSYEPAAAEENAKGQPMNFVGSLSDQTHLIAIDADLDPHKLRARHSDRRNVVIVPAVVAITLDPFPFPGSKIDPKRHVKVTGHIQQLPSSIHVPRPFSDDFRRLQTHGAGSGNDRPLRVNLRYGASLEPWITGLTLDPPAAEAASPAAQPSAASSKLSK